MTTVFAAPAGITAVPGLPTTDSVVLGVHCHKRHFNDPDVAFCVVCGMAMTLSDRRPVLGRRPPLGVLVLDNGSLHPLDRELVIGRAPAADPRVAAGVAGALPMTDPSVSRVHARVVLDGWTVAVTDAGSRNGTRVWLPGEPAWTPVRPGATVALRPGARVAVGRCQFGYYSHRHR